jgi:hypothetical protein
LSVFEPRGNGRRVRFRFGEGQEVLQQVGALQRLHEEEPECGDVELDGSRPELPLAQQIRLIPAQVTLIELIWRRVKVLRELLDSLEVVVNGGRGLVAPLEFLQHRLSEIGHRHLRVTYTLPGWPSAPHA